MATPTPSALAAGFKTEITVGAVSGQVGTTKVHYHTTNDTKAQVETAGYFNPVADYLSVGDGIVVYGDRDGTPFHSSYVVTSATADVTVTEHAAVTQNVIQVVRLPDISTKASDAAVVRFVPGFAGTITEIRSVLNGALATGNATLTAKIDATSVTNGVITATQSGSAAGDVDKATPTANNTFTAEQVISITGGGSSTATATAGLMLVLTPA